MPCGWGGGGPRGENVFVFHLPYELDNEAVKVALQRFGPVHSVRHQHHQRHQDAYCPHDSRGVYS